MASSDPPKEFPDISSKLAAPKKLSAYEKDRQQAEAKRLRAEAENAAALKEFEDSFAQGGDDDSYSSRDPPAGPRGGGHLGFGRAGRGYASSQYPPRSGPGSLGPVPGMEPPSLKRKRALEEMREAQEAWREQEPVGRHRQYERLERVSTAGTAGDEVEDVATPRPTVQLSRMPPDMTVEDISALLSDHLDVYSVQFQPSPAPGHAVARSSSALVSLTAETTTAQIESAVTALKNKYLGCGFRLSISRHLSSVALHPTMSGLLGNNTSSEPFGAEKPKEHRPRFSMRNAPPPAEHGGFAPPESYDAPLRDRFDMQKQPEALVNVEPPLDIETIRAIHILVERLVTEPDPMRAMKIEALLMAKPEVQQDERFAFLYDSRSPAGIYYRYLLWGGEDASERKKYAKGLERVHDDMIMEWRPPDKHVPFLDLTSIADVVTDLDYVSSDEESDDEGGERKFHDEREMSDQPVLNEREYLTPVKRARLVHLLSRLPTSNARLRKGDVARITNFAINHAGTGAEEIVDLLLLNILKPFSYSLASKYEEASSDGEEGSEDYEPDSELPSLGTGTPPLAKSDETSRKHRRDDDPSNAKLIALYIISDILSASSTAGARNAWKYRQLFEAGFKAQGTFAHLGRLEKDLGWGKMKAEQWKRRIAVVFGIWESWSVFSADVHEELQRSFFEPPLTEEELKAEREALAREEKRKEEAKLMGKFKRVGHQVGSPAGSASASPAPAHPVVKAKAADKAPAEEVDGQPMEDVDGTAIDGNVDGIAIGDDVDGTAIGDDVDGNMIDDVDGVPIDTDSVKETKASDPPAPTATPASKLARPRRARAEDMFASDEE